LKYNFFQVQTAEFPYRVWQKLFSHRASVLLASRELENLFRAAELFATWLHLLFFLFFCGDPNKVLDLCFFPSNPPTQLAALRPWLLQQLSLCCPVPASWVAPGSPEPNLASTPVISADEGKAGICP